MSKVLIANTFSIYGVFKQAKSKTYYDKNFHLFFIAAELSGII